MAELVSVLHEVIAEFESEDFVRYVAGAPVMIQDVATAMARDMPRLLLLALVCTASRFFLLF